MVKIRMLLFGLTENPQYVTVRLKNPYGEKLSVFEVTVFLGPTLSWPIAWLFFSLKQIGFTCESAYAAWTLSRLRRPLQNMYRKSNERTRE